MPKSNLYTRTGDAGTTSLVGGERIEKDSVRLEAYGTLDELSSFLGLIAANPDCTSEVKGQLYEIQNMLFNIGCYLATSVKEGTHPEVNGMTKEDISKVESWIDALDEQVPPLRAFVLPGGSRAAAETHMARTICRRTERRVITLANMEYVSQDVIKYLNRLSDYLFVLARYFNFITGISEITWKK